MKIPGRLVKVLALAATIGAGTGVAHAAPPTPSVKSEAPALNKSGSVGTLGASCTQQMRQGGLVVCRAPIGSKVYKNGIYVSQTDSAGIAVIGLKTDEPAGLRVSIDAPGGEMRDFDIEVAQRFDPVRRLYGLDCDKVDARTQEQKDHAARSWELKSAAFARYEEPIAGSISWMKPSDGPFSSPFGPKRHYSGVSKVTGESCSKTSVHRGLDMAVAVGTDLVAPLDGVVTLADPDLYYEGGTLFIDHGRGLVSVFMHLSAVDVEPGQVVRAGERVGATGNTGRTTGPHLHWAVKWRPTGDRSNGGFYIDPTILLDMEETPAHVEERKQDETN